MQSIKDFFIFCSGANPSILKRTPTEVNKYAGIGATIFFTGIFAAIAAGYALHTVFQSNWIVFVIAVLWGLMIFNLDRFIVSTMKKNGSFFKDFFHATPRIVLAILIAIVIAKPLELKIFESEIDAELVKMQQENYMEQDDLVKARFIGRIDSIKNEISGLKSEIDDKAAERDALVAAALAEADGTGGSMRRNLGPIYRSKKAAADLVQTELNSLTQTNTYLIEDRLTQVATLESQMDAELDRLDRVALGGFAARIEGLERASMRSQAIFVANLFIMLLFIAIETAPVFTKLIISRSPYDYELSKHEQKFAVNHKAMTQKYATEILSKVEFDRETVEYKKRAAIQAEKELADEMISERMGSLKSRPFVFGNDFISKSGLFFRE